MIGWLAGRALARLGGPGGRGSVAVRPGRVRPRLLAARSHVTVAGPEPTGRRARAAAAGLAAAT